jgi:hypothetical protein
MSMPPPFPSTAAFPSGAYRLTNASVPVCLLETKDGGDPASDMLAPAALTIVDGKIGEFVVGVHMVGGFVGVVLTGVFASLAVNALGAAGGMVQFGRETVLALAALVFPFVMTFIILWVVDKTVGLRVSVADQDAGLDVSEHNEVGYDWLMANPKGPEPQTSSTPPVSEAPVPDRET